MKLLQINSVVNYGSTGRIAEEIGQTAIAEGWESYIAYGRNAQPSHSKLIKIGSSWDIKVHGLNTRLFDRHGLSSKSATKDLINEIIRINPNIIHLHNIHGYYLNYEILFNFLNNCKIPVVWTFHDCWPITGHCSYFTYINCDKWKNKCYECPLKMNYPSSWFLDRSTKNFIGKKKKFNSIKNITIVTVSKWLSSIVNESFLKDIPLRVIHNGIDTDIFCPKNYSRITDKYRLDHKFILLGVATSWGTRKGLHDYIELSKRLNSDYQILLVGLTKKQIKKIPNTILAIERTENTYELAEFYSAADIVLNLSYEETFGLTTVEGFSCGTPGIVYNSTASPELIDESTGLIVEPGDISGLISAIEHIKLKGKQSYSYECINRVNKLFNKKDRFMDYIRLYESLLK